MKARYLVVALSITTTAVIVASPAAHSVAAEARGVGPSGTTYILRYTCANNSVTSVVDHRTLTTDALFEWKVQTYYNGEVHGTWSGTTQGRRMATATVFGGPEQEYVAWEQAPTGEWVDVVRLNRPPCLDPLTLPFTRLGTISPQRILDTRPGASLGYSGAKPSAGQVIRVPIAGRAGIPANARAAVLSVTMVDATEPGFVQVAPHGQPLGSTSTLNADRAGLTIANTTIVPLGTDGSVDLFTERGSHLLLDVFGYFVDAPTATRAAPVATREGRLQTVSPARALDTRPSSQTGYSGGKPRGGSTTVVDVAAALGSIDRAQMSAVAINVTVVDATAPGYVQVGPAGSMIAGAYSNVNVSQAGGTISNLAIVPVRDGRIEVFTETGADLIVDVTGWFTSLAAPLDTTGLFVPLPPERIVDSRADTLLNSVAIYDPNNRPLPGDYFLTIGLSGYGYTMYGSNGKQPWTKRVEAGAIMTNVTATNTQGPGWVQLLPDGANGKGRSSNLNIDRADQTIANGAIAVTDDRGHDSWVYNSVGTDLIIDATGFFVG